MGAKAFQRQLIEQVTFASNLRKFFEKTGKHLQIGTKESIHPPALLSCWSKCWLTLAIMLTLKFDIFCLCIQSSMGIFQAHSHSRQWARERSRDFPGVRVSAQEISCVAYSLCCLLVLLTIPVIQGLWHGQQESVERLIPAFLVFLSASSTTSFFLGDLAFLLKGPVPLVDLSFCCSNCPLVCICDIASIGSYGCQDQFLGHPLTLLSMLTHCFKVGS